jgi:TetR/AcrR family transcriptional regulator, repressor for neighboring sulfatase
MMSVRARAARRNKPSTRAAKAPVKRRAKRLVAKKVRRRRSAEEAKSEALAAARDLLLDGGPAAVTLMGVAGKMGISHSNLLHHFGTAADLQSALITVMISDLAAALGGIGTRFKGAGSTTAQLVDAVFDAFSSGGAAQIAAWFALSGNMDQLSALQPAVQQVVQVTGESFGYGPENRHENVSSAVLFLGLMALGNALMGPVLEDLLGRENGSARKVASAILSRLPA